MKDIVDVMLREHQINFVIAILLQFLRNIVIEATLRVDNIKEIQF